MLLASSPLLFLVIVVPSFQAQAKELLYTTSQEAMASTTTEEKKPAAKKMKSGLPIHLELAVPFLSSTEDLPRFAVASKACRTAARDSYHKRIRTKYWNIPNETTPVGKPTLAPAKTSYIKPWWVKVPDRWQFNLDEPHPLIFQDDGTWITDNAFFGMYECPQWLKDCRLTFPPDHLLNNDDVQDKHQLENMIV